MNVRAKELLKRVKDDIKRFDVNPLSSVLLQHLLTTPPVDNSELSYGAIKLILEGYNKSVSSEDLQEITRYLSGDRVHALDIFFIYTDADGEDFSLSIEDILKAEKKGALVHPVTYSPISDYDKTTHMLYKPSEDISVLYE